MPFPPAYPYPRFITSDGDRLHPGRTFFGGGPKHALVELHAGVLWRVSSPPGYPGVLHLVSITQPGYFLRLSRPGEKSWAPAAPCSVTGDRLAWALAPVELSQYFSFANYSGWYQKFHSLGCQLHAVDNEADRYTILFVHCYDLPADRRLWYATVSHFILRYDSTAENENFAQLYDQVRAALDKYEVEKLELLRSTQELVLRSKQGAGVIVVPRLIVSAL